MAVAEEDAMRHRVIVYGTMLIGETIHRAGVKFPACRTISYRSGGGND